MSKLTHRHFRVILLSAGGFAVGVALVIFVWFWVAEQPRFFRSPTQVIESDQEWYDNVFDPATRIVAPDLRSLPAPLTTVSYDPPGASHPQEVTIACKAPVSLSLSQLSEIVAADGSGVVTMPGGNRLRLTAVALFLPSDVEWLPHEEPADKVPVWIDPQTGTALVFDPNDPEWTKPRSVPKSRPRLHFRVEVEGDTPMRWRAPEIHDSQSRRSIGAVFSSASIGGDGFFAMDLKTWHQTSLDIGVGFVFGNPEIRKLPIAKNAEVRFGEAALVKVLDVFPYPHRYMRLREDLTIFNFLSKPRRTGSRELAIHQWPPQQSLQIEFQPIPNAEPKKVYGLGGVGSLRWRDNGEESKEVSVYRYPEMGRAVFHLPLIPRLPEVDNLFEVPISRILIKYPSNIARYATEAAEVNRDFSFKSTELSKDGFPLFLEDTTPEEIINRFESLSDLRLYYDEEAALLTDEKPLSLLERWERWWRDLLPGWMR